VELYLHSPNVSIEWSLIKANDFAFITVRETYGHADRARMANYPELVPQKRNSNAECGFTCLHLVTRLDQMKGMLWRVKVAH